MYFARIEETLLSRLLDGDFPRGEELSNAYYDAVLGARGRFRLSQRVQNRPIPNGPSEEADAFAVINQHHIEADDRYMFIRKTVIHLKGVCAYIMAKPGIRTPRKDVNRIVRLMVEYLRTYGAAIPLDREPMPYEGVYPPT